MQKKTRVPVVLVVEDQPQILALLQEFISNLGFEALAALNGLVAEQIAASCPNVIHLLITDIEMPGMDGIRLAQSLKNQRPAIEVIYLSGTLEKVTGEQQAFVEGSICLEKPVNLNTLQSVMSMLLNRALEKSQIEAAKATAL